MDMKYVQSSNILAIGYDEDKSILVIEFKDGSAYEYYDVPESLYYDFEAAPSHGRFAHNNIYKVFNQQRIR